jgi:hypothetical protein
MGAGVLVSFEAVVIDPQLMPKLAADEDIDENMLGAVVVVVVVVTGIDEDMMGAGVLVSSEAVVIDPQLMPKLAADEDIDENMLGAAAAVVIVNGIDENVTGAGVLVSFGAVVIDPQLIPKLAADEDIDEDMLGAVVVGVGVVTGIPPPESVLEGSYGAGGVIQPVGSVLRDSSPPRSLYRLIGVSSSKSSLASWGWWLSTGMRYVSCRCRCGVIAGAMSEGKMFLYWPCQSLHGGDELVQGQLSLPNLETLMRLQGRQLLVGCSSSYSTTKPLIGKHHAMVRAVLPVRV